MWAVSVSLSVFGMAQDPVAKIPADTEIQTTLTGLKYSVLRKGEGDSPKLGDRVTIHYTGWLTNGTKFDSSRDKGAPMKHELGRFVPGWNEALQLMRVGSHWKLTIPPQLGYGDRGAPPTIPAGATLVFEVELLAFEEQPRPPEFREADPKAQQSTESGLKYEVLEAAPAGAVAPTADQMFELVFTIWSPDGQMLQSSVPSGQGIAGKIEHMRVPFLKEVPLLMAQGATWRVEVPAMPTGPDQIPLLKTPTIWQVTMAHVLVVPEFQLPPDDQLTTTASGLRYKVLSSAGEKATKVTMGQQLLVHYAGWLTDGTKFDASYDRGQPIPVHLVEPVPLVKGWVEGLQLMREGDSYLFVVPGDLAYGEAGRPPQIGPNATLVFAVNVYKVMN